MMQNDNLICWHEPWHDPRCGKKHDGELRITFGRCRSGKRWFWYAGSRGFGYERQTKHGWSNSEDEAWADVRAAVIRIANGRPATAFMRHDWARSELKDHNVAKRAAKPPSNAKDTPVVEYLYSWGERFRIIKRTKQRVYYVKKGERIDERGEPIDNPFAYPNDERIGFITYEQLNNGLSDGHRWLYPSLEAIQDERRARDEEWRRDRIKHGLPPDASNDDLSQLKAAMAAAHPDKGGSSAAFIEARQRYVAARRAQRSVKGG